MTSEEHAAELAAYIEERRFGIDEDGLHFGPTDLLVIAQALGKMSRCSEALGGSPLPALAFADF